MRKIPEYITNCGGIPPAIPEEISESPADCGGIPPGTADNGRPSFSKLTA